MLTGQTSRNPLIDLVRLFAAFGVVFIHVHTESGPAEMCSHFFLILCVPFFYMTSLFYFTVSLKRNASVQDTIRRIWQKIVVPFLVWSVIYVGLLSIKGIITGGTRGLHVVNLVGIFVYGGSAEQMYYLPELIAMQLIILGISLLITGTKRVIGLCLFMGATYYLIWGHSQDYFGVTLTSHVLTYTLTAFYLSSRINAKHWAELVMGVILITLSLSTLWDTNVSGVRSVVSGLPLGGLGLFLVTSNSTGLRIPNWLKLLGSTTFGVYLSHVVFLEGLEFLFEKTHFAIRYTLFTKLIVSFLIFSASVFFTLFIRRAPILRQLLLGEK